MKKHTLRRPTVRFAQKADIPRGPVEVELRRASETRPAFQAAASFANNPAFLPIIDLALSGVIAVVGTATVVGTLSAQSSRIALAISIACGLPVG
jgi:hypothetical protein